MTTSNSPAGASPPRLAQLLLEGLAGGRELQDDVLGDLTEEFAARTQREGVRAARRWYRREALRSAWHLLADRVSALRAKDVAHLLGVALSSYVLALVLVMVAVGMLRSLLVASGWARGVTINPPWYALASMALVLATISGYVAAFLETRRPLVAALVLGVCLATVELWIWTVGLFESPAWYGFMVPPLVVAGAITGALWRVAIASRTGTPSDATR